MGWIAPQVTEGNLDSSATLSVASGNSIYVYGITFSNASAAPNGIVTMRKAGGGATLALIPLDAADVKHLDVGWYADDGVEFVGNLDDLRVTILHSSTGAQNTRDFATKVTHGTLTTNATVVQVDSGNPVNVCGMILSNTGSNSVLDVTMRTADGNATTLLKVGLDDTHLNDVQGLFVDIPFCADKGIEFISDDGDADLTVTVFHTSTGV